MKLSPIFAGIVGLSCLPVFASTANIKEFYNNSKVLDAVQQAGFTVYADGDACKKAYGVTYPTKKVLVICVNQHNDLDELVDTIRHESIHVAQSCKNGPLFTQASISKYASPGHFQSLRNYPEHQRVRELEAQVVAANSTDEEVIKIINKYC
jgi:hypothetical protein